MLLCLCYLLVYASDFNCLVYLYMCIICSVDLQEVPELVHGELEQVGLKKEEKNNNKQINTTMISIRFVNAT